MFYISGIHGNQRLYTAPIRTSDLVSPVVSIEGSEKIEGEGGSAGPAPRSALHRNPYARLDEQIPERTPALTVSQIMTSPVITIGVGEKVEHAWKLFHEKRFRHLPVLSLEGKLVGILSDRDLLALGLSVVGHEGEKKEQLIRPVSELMTTDVLTTRPSTGIRAVAKVMFTEKISAMPVVSDKVELVGMVTTSDILRTLVHNAPLELWT